MKQYLLSIYQPDGPTPPPDVLKKVMAEVGALVADTKAQGVWVFNGGLHPPSTATVLRLQGSEMLTIDGPFAEGKEHIGGFIDPQSVRPRRRARAGRASSRERPRCRSRCGRSERKRKRRRCAPAEIERVFREEYGRAVAVLVRPFGDIDLAEEAVQDAFTVALQRWPSSGLPPSPAGWIITTARNRAIDRLRREASREDRHAEAALLHAAGRAEHDDGGRRARRSPAADLHVLPSGARRPRAGGVDAAPARRADDRRDRARVSHAGVDDGAAAGEGEGQDPRRRHPVRRAGRTRSAGAAPRRPRRHLSDLQRRVHRVRRAIGSFATICAPRRSGSGRVLADLMPAMSRKCWGCWR